MLTFYIFLQDPRTENLPLVKSFWLIFALVGFYMYFILSLGPKLMKNRPPFKLNRIIQIYNIIQIILSFYMTVVVSCNNYILHFNT